MVSVVKVWKEQKTLQIIFVLSFAPILFVYIAEYVFDMKPCNLCLWQRKPLIAILILSTFAALSQRCKKLVINVSIVLIIVNIIISFYHVGVENNVFSMPKSCENEIISTDNIKELEKIIKQSSATRCDKPVYIFNGISMAFMNFIYSTFFLTWVFRNRYKHS